MDRKWTKGLSVWHKLWLLLRHGPFVLFWCWYDLLLWAYVSFCGIEDYIGAYVYIISKSEWAWWFGDSDVACGYNAYAVVKIGLKPEWFTISGTIDIINHEVLHQVLSARISEEAYEKLNNIHGIWQYVKVGEKYRLWGIDFIKKFPKKQVST